MSQQNVALMRPLTVVEALARKEDLTLYVMNMVRPTREQPDMRPGNINLGVKGDDGSVQTVVIPKTHVPIDMTMFISRENLLLNRHFRQLVQLGHIAIAHPEDAERAIQNSASAQKEINRVLSLNSYGAENNSPARMLELRSSPLIDGGNGVPTLATESAPTEFLPDPFAVGIVNRAAGNEDVADLIGDIEIQRLALTEADLTYIANNVEDPVLKQAIADMISA